MAVSVPQGFRLAGTHCGIKRDPAKEDLVLILADRPSVAAGVYTQNQVVAASVTLCRGRTPSANVRAVVICSGNANACTGTQGDRDAHQLARWAAGACGIEEQQVLVLATGVIGQGLPMDRIGSGITALAGQLAADQRALTRAARGMMTTDTTIKLHGRRCSVDGVTMTVTGMAKGAAMIGPHMATMLAVVLTDAVLTPGTAQEMLAHAVDRSFNAISVDGHMSTNDSVLLLASGAARDSATPARRAAFQEMLAAVCQELAHAIVADGEGAGHIIEIQVEGCASRNDAHRIAATVANSPLVKTAVAGADPNWGRIISAAGYAGVPFQPDRVRLEINGVALFDHGAPVPFDTAAVSKTIRRQRDVLVALRFAEGQDGARFLTTDLTTEYVRLNSEYTT